MAILKDKKVLSYPADMGSAVKDSESAESQYTIFTITTDEKATKLRNDAKYSDVYTPVSNTGSTGKATNVVKNDVGFELIRDKKLDPDIVKLNSQKSVESTKFVQNKGAIKLDRVIVLSMPNDYIVQTSVEYDQNFDPGALSKLGDILSQSGSAQAAELTKLGKNAVISGIVNTFKSGITDTQRLLGEERLAVNPRKEVMFSGFGFRPYSFRFTFAPRSQEESEVVNNIIESFRYYALPEISEAKFFYLFPAQFDIYFMLGQKVNPNIPKITTSVLRTVSVNYSPFGTWATLPNGAPVQIDMTLDFLEIELVDRNRVYKEGSELTSGF